MVTAAKRCSQVITHMGIGFLIAAGMSGSALLGCLAVLVEPILNVLLLPFHEHAWSAFQARASTPGRRRALAAAEKVSQATMHAIVAFGVMFGVSGSAACGGIAALLEPVCNVLVMPVHDRWWARLRQRLLAQAPLSQEGGRL